jgi:twitching motility two-component system response regulator PilG
MKSILIIDDEQSFLLTLELVLKSAGYNVLTATDGEEGLIKMKDSRPDLVLLDIMMPGMGGLETLKMMKAHPDFKKTPVLLMSGARPLVKQTEYKWAGFLYKPFLTAELFKAIKEEIN